MNASEFYELQIMQIGLLNSHLEIWIGFTFATLVAFHLLGNRISLLLLLLIEFLYSVGTLVMATRYAHTSSVIGDFNQRLIAAGQLPYPTPPAALGYLLFVLFVVSTLGTIGFGIYCYRHREEAT